MEKRIGTVTLLVSDRTRVAEINRIISEHSDIVLCRQGLPFRERPVAVIALIVEGEMGRINALCGKVGNVPGVKAKAVITE